MSAGCSGRGSSPPAGPARRRHERGQASVELALVLPIAVALVLLLVQAGLVVRDQILVVHAAREAARALAADDGGGVGEAQAALQLSSPLDLRRARVTVQRDAELVRVTIRYRSPTRVPLLGRFAEDVELTGEAAMRPEEQADDGPGSGLG